MTRQTRGRAAAGYRTCTACAGVYQRTETHTDTRWCPTCITAHVGRCRDCRGPFDLDGHHTTCPSCRGQVPLFDLRSARWAG